MPPSPSNPSAAEKGKGEKDKKGKKKDKKGNDGKDKAGKGEKEPGKVPLRGVAWVAGGCSLGPLLPPPLAWPLPTGAEGEQEEEGASSGPAPGPARPPGAGQWPGGPGAPALRGAIRVHHVQLWGGPYLGDRQADALQGTAVPLASPAHRSLTRLWEGGGGEEGEGGQNHRSRGWRGDAPARWAAFSRARGQASGQVGQLLPRRPGEALAG